MTRAILDEAQIHPAARPLIGSKHQDIVREVQAAYVIGAEKAPANPVTYNTIRPQ